MSAGVWRAAASAFKSAACAAAARRSIHTAAVGRPEAIASLILRTLTHQQAVSLLDQTLQQEKKTDADLSQIAETAVNAEAE
jgi:hypothetical protein